MTRTERCGAVLLGSGAYLPRQVVTNDRLEEALCLSPGAIEEKTGIKERRLCEPHESMQSMAAAATQDAVVDANVDSIDLIVVARDLYITQHSRSVGLTVVAALQENGVDVSRVSVVDIVNYCLGFANALDLARLKVEAGEAERVLVVASADYTSIIEADPQLHTAHRASMQQNDALMRYSLEHNAYYQAPRYNMGLWGCGAGAVVVGRSADRQIGPLVSQLSHSVVHDVFGFGDLSDGRTFASLDGRAIAGFAFEEVPAFLAEFLRMQELALDDVGLVVPHQPNALLLRGLFRSLGLECDRYVLTCDSLGNLGCASIPVAYHLARSVGRAQEGRPLLFVPFGDTQLTVGAMLLRP